MEKMKPGMDSALIKNKRADVKPPKVLIDGEIRLLRRLWKTDISHMKTRERQAVTQDNVRLKRIKDRAKGVRFALGYGKKREGIFCVGGVCREVPASNGFNVRLSSNF